MLVLFQIMLSYFVGIIILSLLIVWCARWIEHLRYRSVFVCSALVVLVGSLIVVTWSGLQMNVPAPLPSSVRLIVGNSGGVYQGLRASDASQSWRSSTGVNTYGMTGTTTVSGDLIYEIGIPYPSAGSSASQALRSLIALVAVRANDGQLVWRKDISLSQTKPGCPSLDPSSNLLVAEGKVYTCQGNTLYAFQASNGEQAWSLPMEQTTSPLQSFTAGEGLLFLSSRSGDIRALRATNGALVWHRNTYRGVVLTLANKILYIEEEGFVSALRAHDGRLLWQFSHEGLALESLSATNTHVYVSTSAYSTTNPRASISLNALDSQTGGLLWHQTVAIPSDLAGPINTKPGEAGKTLYVVAGFTLSALRTSDGSLLWRYQQNNGFLLWQGPDDQRGVFLTLIEVNGVIFLPVDGYKSVFTFLSTRPQKGIVALNAANGTLYWSQFELEPQPWQWVGVAS